MTFLIPRKTNKNQFLVSNHLSATIIEWFGNTSAAKIIQETFTVETAHKYAKATWNIALASPKYTFVGGTFRGSACGNTSEPNAELFTYNKQLGVQKIDIPDLKVSAGIVWNKEGTKFYHVAGCDGVIREFDYDSNTRRICK